MTNSTERARNAARKKIRYRTDPKYRQRCISQVKNYYAQNIKTDPDRLLLSRLSKGIYATKQYIENNLQRLNKLHEKLADLERQKAEVRSRYRTRKEAEKWAKAS